MNYDDPAFVLAFTALLPVLGIGIALLTGLRRNDVLPVLIALIVIGVLWVAAGCGIVLGSEPSLSLSVFYGAYLMLTPVLLTTVMPRGADQTIKQRRESKGEWLTFVLLWFALVQLAVAAWVLNVVDGWLAAGLALLDFGGATVLYLSTACAGLAWLVVARNRGPTIAVSNPKRAGVTIAALWVGSFAVTVGSEAVPGDMALTTAVNTAIAPVCAVVAWAIVERIRHHRVSLNGAVRGVFAGLVAITAAVDIVSPFWAGILGLAAGALASALAGPRGSVLGLLLTQLSSAILGLVFIGVLGESVGGLLTGSWAQLGAQLFGVGVIAALSFTFAVVLAVVITRLRTQRNWLHGKESAVR